jgi:hypothetical protein
MLIFWNNLNIFEWNNTYLHLHEIGKTLKLLLLFWKYTKIPKDIEKNKEICFSFDILGSIKKHFEKLQLLKCLFKKNPI